MSDCCGPDAPPEREQPPGLPELRWRSTTWARARAAMLRRAPRQETPPGDSAPDAARPLAALTTRADDDPTIALIDAWAATCDVLAFYAERLLNEGYLGTAVEQASLVELGRMIGYERAPGVAASTRLAFTVDDGTPDGAVTVPAGTPVMSVPAQDELPVTFATTESVIARPEHNRLSARRRRPQSIVAGQTIILLAGVTTGLSPGDPVVVVGQDRADDTGPDTSERWDLRQVVAVEPDAEAGRTRITLGRGLGDGYTDPAAVAVRVVAFAERARLFGHDAPDARMMSQDVRDDASLMQHGQWRDFTTLADDHTRVQIDPAALDLDREYPSVVTDGWVCLHSATEVELYRVERSNPAARTEFSLSGTVTRVFVDSTEHLDDFKRRGTAVLVGSRELALAEEDDPDPVAGRHIQLGSPVPALDVGRTVLVTGASYETGEPVVVTTDVVAWSDDDADHPEVEVAAELPPMRRDSVVVWGNTALATHGAPVGPEILGSGDASRAHQSFRLGHAPLTWVQDAAGGIAPELELRVGEARWSTVDTLYGTGPRDHVAALRLDPDGHTVVTFGDGRRGARLPSGTQNVSATYRAGAGRAGDLPAERLTLLQQRPPGLAAVTNPGPATGGADADAPEELRRLAPRTVLTMDRLVSLQDYGDYAAAWPGVGKARADALWDGHARFVHVTLASVAGEPFPPDDPVLIALRGGVDRRRDPAHRVAIGGYVEVGFRVVARVVVDPDRVRDDVLAAAAEALAAAFAFEARRFGQPVLAAEVVAVMHDVDGVAAVDLDKLARTDAAGVVPPLPDVALPAASPAWSGGAVTPAELLLLDPADVVLTGWEDSP